MNNPPSDQNVTTGEILEAINKFATHVEEQFSDIKTEIKGIKSEMGIIKSEMTLMKTDFGEMKKDMGVMNSGMATKDYIDKKFNNLKGDNVELIRKEDAKVDQVVTELDDHRVLPKESIASIKQFHVFPAPPLIQ